ncbi:phage major capsid protein [Micromonospora sp. NPDC049891]|uniref:phage major capsid protein n=1 Tax=Micromonospora sp. NPDC049891 TaxID=3155655 RepID=UPI0033EE929F
MKKQSEQLADEMEIIRAELKTIQDAEDPTEDELSRGEALLEEWDVKKAVYDKAVARESKVDEVMRASLASGNRESGPTVITRTKRNPYEELHRSKTWTDADFIERAKDAVEQAPEHMTDDARENATALIERAAKGQRKAVAKHILTTGSPEYHEAFEDYLNDPENTVNRAALSLTAANGGYLIPFTLDPSIILTNNGSSNPYRRIAAIKQTATNEWNGVTSAGVNAGWLAEAAEASDNTPTVGQVKIPVHKGAAWLFGSFEVLQDSDFASELPMLIADAKDRIEETAFTTGNGTTAPKGIITAATTTVTAAGTAAYAVGDVYALQAAVPPRWRDKGSWLMNISTVNRTRQFDEAGGSSFWANLGAGTPERLLGRPVYESSTMASALTTGSKIAVYGDFSQFAIVDRIGVSLMYEPLIKGENGRPTGQAGWFAYWRTGSDVLTPNAFRVLVTG